jgi:hypothetical protein
VVLLLSCANVVVELRKRDQRASAAGGRRLLLRGGRRTLLVVAETKDRNLWQTTGTYDADDFNYCVTRPLLYIQTKGLVMRAKHESKPPKKFLAA